MALITFGLFIIASILILRLRPLNGLFVYCASLLWYPQYLSMKIGTVDFSLSRAVVLVLLVVIIQRDKLHFNFHWRLIDTLMMIYVVFRLISISQNELVKVLIEREGGSFIDTVLIYFVVRMILKTKEDMLLFFNGLVILSIPIAIIGVYQSITGYNVYAFMKQYNAFRDASQSYLVRHGFYRADASIGNYIAYGMYFASLVPISILIFNAKHKIWSIILTFIMIAGVLSSMSSGPYFALAVGSFTVVLFPFRNYWKVVVVTVIIALCFLNFYSNRTWYEALTRLAFSGETAYYRVALINEALHGGMSGNWITGYGYVGLDAQFNSLGKYWGWEHQDLTNIYILTIVKYGILGLIPFIFINITYYISLFKGYYSLRKSDAWIVWCFFAALFGWNISMQTVAPLNQVVNMLYVYIAICANMPLLIGTDNNTIID